ncbi:helix-turn-helix transcriptional regulator [Lentzea sp.]|uniref:helix-turn-helix domain-containing protein n=1 Tax=Lentzea sp. TaxID=56099 RepID=UPI002BB8E0DF|nr:helix-turn-helix transcriptional regulator [Lentzea sp.]HUQ58491.1 helix-turn-helix transcriptional regulator [Lentzea sp.]
MTSAEEPALQLARRLRALRVRHWPGKRITQEQLSQAFDVSVPLISSWERPSDPVLPPPHRLEAYAAFFATSRSVDGRPFQLVSELTEGEQAVRDSLLTELMELRDRAQGDAPAESAAPFTDNLWRFPVGEDITIVCSELPKRLLPERLATNPDDPDYAALYRFSDLDSLLELHGHIRAMNPVNRVSVLTGSGRLPADMYTSHLVLLGGVDWNHVTADMLERIDLPIRQQERPDDADSGGFEVVENGEVVETFYPRLRGVDGRQVLEQDVAHFHRSPNPFNRKRTVTMCNGIYSRGVLGAVRALTDPRFRDRNNAYAQSRLAEQQTFSILSRVMVVSGEVVTPDWTVPEYFLHDWAE